MCPFASAAPALQLRDAWLAGLRACNGAAVVRMAMEQSAIEPSAMNGAVLASAAEWRGRRLHVLAIGKAALTMTRGVLQACAARHCPVTSVLAVTRDERDFSAHDYQQWHQRGTVLTVLYGDHPLPGPRSLQAGEAVWQFVRRLPADAALLVLISGGGSALCERLQAGLSLSALAEKTAAMLADGRDIHAINAERKRWSTLKNGGLLAAVPAAVPVRQWLISDVRGDDPSVIASGPFVVPANRSDAGNTPDVTNAARAAVTTRVLASAGHFVAAANAALRCAGGPALQSETLAGDVTHATAAIVAALRDASTAAPRARCWQGEAGVPLPAVHGRGGRCQHLALQLALALMPAKAKGAVPEMNFAVLCASTDGSDGNTDAAAVCLTPALLARIAPFRDAAQQALLHADSHAFWRQHGGLWFTGATGTNVMDVVMLLRA